MVHQPFWSTSKRYRDNFLGQDLANAPFLIEDLDAFTQFDLNLQFQPTNVGSSLLPRTKLYSMKNNYRWSNYQVYGTQILLGTRYNFDLAF